MCSGGCSPFAIVPMCVYLDGLFIERPGRCMFSLIVAQNNGPFSGAYTSRARPAAALLAGAGMSLVAGGAAPSKYMHAARAHLSHPPPLIASGPL